MNRYINGPGEDYAQELGDGAWKLVRRGVTVAIFSAATNTEVLARLAPAPTEYERREINRDRRRAWLRDIASVNPAAAAMYAREFGHLGR